MTTAAPRLLTTGDLLAMPDDGVERWLIRGEIREVGRTRRNFDHSRVSACVTFELEAWRRQQHPPPGLVLCGESGVRLERDPETTVGVDVVYISSELATKRSRETTLVDGIPILVVEILSPNDTQSQIHDKINLYLDVGVRLVWVIDPEDRTVRVYRPGEEPYLLNAKQELTAEPDLPGFRVNVGTLFE